MPVQVASFLLPKNNGSWYLLEDKYLKGGLRIANDATERDSIHIASRKAGMIVLTTNDNLLWQLSPDLLTWNPYTVQTVSTLYTYKQIVPDSTWEINHSRVCRYFTYSVYDEQGKSVLPDEVTTIDDNNILISFSIPISGHCVLNFDFNA